MAIKEYIVVEPPTSGEVDALIAAALNRSRDDLARGAVDITVMPVAEITPPEDMHLKVRETRLGPDSSIRKALGRAVFSVGNETLYTTDSAFVILSANPAESARASAIYTPPVFVETESEN